MSKKTVPEYYCVCVQRDYESVWRVISKHDTHEQAQAAVDARKAYTGVFNYDNAKFCILSRSEAKAEFGSDWEYKAIGEAKHEKPTRKSKTG